jgi:hypothetical protein
LRGGNRNDLPQLLDDGSLVNVPRVEYMIEAFEMSSNHRIEYTKRYRRLRQFDASVAFQQMAEL